MKQKCLSILILCTSCYLIIASYYPFLQNHWEKEFSLPTLDKNPTNISLVEAAVPHEKKPSLKLYAKYSSLMDASSGRILYSQNGDKPVPMASTTKIMTCIIALENASLEDTITVSKHASAMPDVQLNITAGEQYKLKDLLYSLMLESHNDVAVAIAEHIGGSVEGFAKLMNEKAAELGCGNTHFVTPNGLDADGHQTTAIELAKIACYAIGNSKFIEITNTPSYQFKELTKGRSFKVNNKDRFLTSYKGAIGIKTGFTGKAGFCFVGAVDRNGIKLVSVVLASGWPPNKNYKWSDTTKLMDYGFNNYTYNQIFDSDISLHPLPVKDGKDKQVNISLQGTFGMLWSAYDSSRVEILLPEILTAPVIPGTILGKATFYVNDEVVFIYPIKAVDRVEPIDFNYCLKKILSYWVVGVLGLQEHEMRSNP